MPPRMKQATVGRGKASSSSNKAKISPEFATRPIHTGRTIDFKFFTDEGFSFSQKLEIQGWKHLFQGDGLYYPELIREFYQNIVFGDEEYSTVMGVKIDLSVDCLGAALQIPTDGSIHIDDEDRNEVVNTVLEMENASGSELVLAKDVSIDTRLLHHIVANAIVPKVGRFDIFNEAELYIVYNIINEHPICLPHIIINEMKKAERKGKGFLPYGSFLTHLFRGAGINLKKEFGQPIQSVHIYNVHTLHRMGIYKKDGNWSREKKMAAQQRGIRVETSPPRAEELSSSPRDVPQRSISPRAGQSHTDPQSSAESNALLVELITSTLMQKLESGGWLTAPSSVISASMASTSQISTNHEETQRSLLVLSENVTSLTAQVEKLVGKQNQMDERVTQMVNDHKALVSSLQEILPTLHIGESENHYAQLHEEAGRLSAMMVASKDFMQNMAHAAQGLSMHLHSVCSKQQENVYASLERLHAVDVIVRQIHKSQTELVTILSQSYPEGRSHIAPPPSPIPDPPEPQDIPQEPWYQPEDPPIPEPRPASPIDLSFLDSPSSQKKPRKRTVRKRAKRSRVSNIKFDFGDQEDVSSDQGNLS